MCFSGNAGHTGDGGSKNPNFGRTSFGMAPKMKGEDFFLLKRALTYKGRRLYLPKLKQLKKGARTFFNKKER